MHACRWCTACSALRPSSSSCRPWELAETTLLPLCTLLPVCCCCFCLPFTLHRQGAAFDAAMHIAPVTLIETRGDRLVGWLHGSRAGAEQGGAPGVTSACCLSRALPSCQAHCLGPQAFRCSLLARYAATAQLLAIGLLSWCVLVAETQHSAKLLQVTAAPTESLSVSLAARLSKCSDESSASDPVAGIMHAF